MRQRPMLRADALLPPPADGHAVPGPSQVDTWRLRLLDFAHTRVELGPALRVQPGPLVAEIALLIVHAGEVSLSVPDQHAPLGLGPGDVVLLGRGCCWELACAGGLASASVPRVVELTLAPPLVPAPPLPSSRFGTAAAEVSFVALGFEADATAELLEWLPQVLRAPPGPLRGILDGSDRQLFEDPTIFARTLEILVLDLLRRRPPHEWKISPGSPAVRKAVGLMRSQLTAPWRVATLAKQVGLSRSAFAARFTLEVGEPPLHHLAKLRLRAAASRLLSGGDEPIKAIAAGVGYGSLPSFSKAFRGLFGVAPGAYRARSSRRR